MKISLCMIVGNVEEYIRRCLASFKPVADEICVVRAIGKLRPDATLKIAEEEFGAKTSEYINNLRYSHWPHVDNFAAARQMSFDLATGDYCFWCDSDDVLESGAEAARQLAHEGGYVAYVFPYKIFARGLSVPRARMMLKNSGKWHYPVHEDFRFHIEPAKVAQDDRVVITHLPNFATKTGSHDRNLTILRSIPDEKMTSGLLYHMHVELLVANKLEESIAIAKRALAFPDIGRPEKYEIFLNFAQAADTPETKAAFLHQAYSTDPRRREALCLLANNALNFSQNEVALAYAEQMRATKPLAIAEWNDRSAVYGWVGEDIYAQALRANGYNIRADQVRVESLRHAGGPTIALVHATRGRFEKAAMTRKMWLDLAAEPARIEHIFVIDDDDRASDPLKRMHHLTIPAGGGCVAAWNHGALATTAPVLLQLSDDFTPPPKWDQLILERLALADDVTRGYNEPKVLAVNDGFRTDDLICLAICTRNYFLIDHFFFHPWFKGVYSDNWFTELARARGCVINAKDLVFQHEHPFGVLGKNMMPGSRVQFDETYRLQNSSHRYEEGKTIIEQLRKRQDWSSVPGYFSFWTFYEFIARQLQDGDTVAEVGVWMGRSVIYLAQELQRLNKKVRILAIDHFQGELNQPEHQAALATSHESLRAIFERNIQRCGVADMIEIIDGDSAASAERVPNASLAFCFIDAAHDYESVCRDLLAWSPKVKPGGYFAGHDAFHPPVKQAVTDVLKTFDNLGNVWSTKI
jgi:glycosyltransferase involved in cell wall biosynthesis